MLDLPITNGPNFDGSYVTHKLTGDSKIPSSLNERYFDLFGYSTNCDERFFSSSNDALIFFFVSISFIKMKFHGCENPTDGA